MKKEELLKDIPVIIISNSGQPVELDRAKSLGAVDWLIKTEFDPNIKSRNLIIGNRQAEKYITFHSDTTLDGLNGVDLEIIKDVIKSNVEDIKSGSTAIIIFGAKNIGKIGEKVFYMENKYCLSSTEKTG